MTKDETREEKKIKYVAVTHFNNSALRLIQCPYHAIVCLCSLQDMNSPRFHDLL